MEETKERALLKLKTEIDNDISKIVGYAKECTSVELYFLIYLLRNVRILRLNPSDHPPFRAVYISAVTAVYEEALKYSIQLVYKYGNHAPSIEEEGLPRFNNPLSIAVHKTASILNSKFETTSFFELFDIKLNGDQDRYAEINMKALFENDDVKKFFDYFLRIDLSSQKETLRTLNDHLEHFRSEFDGVSDLFRAEFGVTFETYIRFYYYIGNKLLRKLTEFFASAPKLENGNMAPFALSSILMFTPHIMISEKEITDALGEKIRPLINRLILSPEEINEKELRFYALNRKPLLRAITGHLIVSPELFLDGLFTNTHYSFLEGKHKEAYKAKTSDLFLERIINISRKFGYRVLRRNLELFEGKQQIGDLDIVLRNRDGHTLLIEAKKHSLPLEVYFKNVQAVADRLSYLHKDWEKKVNRRIAHLSSNYSRYKIEKSFAYIIVTKNPEIISHYSNLMCLTIEELEVYLSSGNLTLSFNDVFNIMNRQSELNEAELEMIRQEDLTSFI
ncbi:hypothetical protein [Cohnella thailandensis]|uniref:Uncharacterized protein n=1 Tax=Cohnella thailandensis TaxID=557557 RepID=A0A841SMX2_9BACL|nr:hypothetical protein [Cohnella thailandensis]MBB6633294.1 hypothetical protein [Cohnella thailandensis]MBP1977371.1 hypothetical protein [Cohnella thailandensis]